MIKEGLLYAQSHEWIKVEGNVGVVGISDHAQHELGSVVFIDLPKIGKTVKQGDAFGAVESVKAASDLYLPVSGKIIAVNEDLDSAPEMLNDDPYGAWICKIEIENSDELESLMTPEKYTDFCEV